MRNVIANTAKAMFPEPNIDRAGRLRGNLRAVSDFMRHCCHPKRSFPGLVTEAPDLATD